MDDAIWDYWLFLNDISRKRLIQHGKLGNQQSPVNDELLEALMSMMMKGTHVFYLF